MNATTWPRTPRYDDAVDLDRYPINAPASPACRAPVQACRDQLASHGVAQLAGFLTPAPVSRMSTSRTALTAPQATHLAYSQPSFPSGSGRHQRARGQVS